MTMKLMAIHALLLAFDLQHVIKQRWLEMCVEGYHIPGIDTKYYAQEGDIYIGVFLHLTDGVDEDLLCTNSLPDLHPNTYPVSQGVWWVVNKINTERLISRSLQLGFVIINSCVHTSVGMKVHSLRLLRTTNCIAGTDRVCTHGMHYGIKSFSDLGYLVAVMNNAGSTQNVAITSMFSTSRIPIVAMTASSDELSDENQYRYFSRMVPPDQYQMQAIISIILLNKWTYVSVLYVEGFYGENAVFRLQKLFSEHKGVCMATVHKVPERFTQEIADEIVDSLVKNKKARVLIALLEESKVTDILEALSRWGLVDPSHFVWIFSDSAANLNYNKWGQYLEGSLFIEPVTSTVPDFNEWFLKRKPHDATDDPWFTGAYEHFCKCSFKDGTCDSQTPIGSCNIESRSDCIGLLYDAIYTVANATARALNTPDCPLERDWKECLTGPRVLGEIRQTRQEGATGWLELTQNGDRLSGYVISQVIGYSTASGSTLFQKVLVANYDITKNRLLHERNFSWANNSPVRSDCSSPCQDDEARILNTIVECCWSCHRCEVNQVVDRNLSNCKTCALLYWPSDKKDNCVLIPITHFQIWSARGISQTVFSFLGLILCIAVCVFFYKHRQAKAIKASSIELSYIMLLGLILGYVLILASVFHFPDSDEVCRVYFLMYSTSLTLLYAPLFLRIFRIYRIFVSGSAKKPTYIDPFSVVVSSFGLVFFVIIISVVSMLNTSWYKIQQPDELVKYVEMGCKIPLSSLLMACGYNFVLLSLCFVLAVKTRHLPENFNESGFICASACSSFIILSSFIPLYMNTAMPTGRLMVLSLTLGIHHTVNLFLLFVSKMYAVLFVDKEQHRYNISSGTHSQTRLGHRKPFVSIVKKNKSLFVFQSRSSHYIASSPSDVSRSSSGMDTVSIGSQWATDRDGKDRRKSSADLETRSVKSYNIGKDMRRKSSADLETRSVKSYNIGKDMRRKSSADLETRSVKSSNIDPGNSGSHISTDSDEKDMRYQFSLDVETRSVKSSNIDILGIVSQSSKDRDERDRRRRSSNIDTESIGSQSSRDRQWRNMRRKSSNIDTESVWSQSSIDRHGRKMRRKSSNIDTESVWSQSSRDRHGRNIKRKFSNIDAVYFGSRSARDTYDKDIRRKSPADVETRLVKSPNSDPEGIGSYSSKDRRGSEMSGLERDPEAGLTGDPVARPTESLYKGPSATKEDLEGVSSPQERSTQANPDPDKGSKVKLPDSS